MADIQVAARNGTETVKGTAIKGTYFAVTRSLGCGPSEQWTLTHVPTGLSVTKCRHQQPLKAIAKRLSQLEIDWSVTIPDGLKRYGPLCLPIIRECKFGVDSSKGA
jgi:hypothetical protein